MTARSREELERELAHVHFVLAELPHWDPSSVLKGARNYLTQRYERQVRILHELMGDAAPASVPVSAAPTEAAAPMSAVETLEPGDAPAQPAFPPPAPEGFQVVYTAPEFRPHSPDAEVQPAAAAPFLLEQARVESSPSEPVQAQAGEEDLEQEEQEEQEDAPPLPALVSLPVFEAPPVRTSAARIVEEVSTWDTVWRPFLYESIGWFIGAFLIVAGSLYLAFDSWSGLTSFSRSLVVFGMTAGYASAFSICGALLGRRETLAGAGRILGLIGAAVAPFAGVALGPVDGLSLQGIPVALLIPLLLGWSVGAAVLVRKPAESFDEPSRPHVQIALVGTTLMMGLAPLFAHLGAFAFWLDVLPCALFFVLARQRLPEPRTSKALAFALAAPLYLLLLFGVRLHLALAAAGTPVAPASYAPLLAFLLITCLRLRPLPPEEAADALSVGVVALQVGCLMLAATGAPPAFFLTAATLTWSVLGLSWGEGLRVRWLYLAYAGAYLSYGSVGQLLPGVVHSVLDALEARLGYASSGALPFNYGALTAVPFVLAGVVLAAWLLARSWRTSEALDEARAEILLHCTAAASPIFVLLGHMGSDVRPAFWTTLGLLAICVGAGLRLERLYLTLSGCALTFFLAYSSLVLFGLSGASLVCGGVALGFAALYRQHTGAHRPALGLTVGWLAFMGFVYGLGAGDTVASLGGMALSGTAALAVAWMFAQPDVFALAAFAAAAVVPKAASLLGPEWVPLALAVSGLSLSVLGERGGRVGKLGVPGVAYALLAFGWGVVNLQPWLGVIVLLSSAAVAVASRTFPTVRPLAVILAGIALLPRVEALSFWPWMTPQLSAGLFLLWSLGASVAAARGGRTPSTLTAGIVALVGPALGMVSGTESENYPLLLCAALTALCTARALYPAVSVVAASVWLGASLVLHHDAARTLAMATLLSVLALLESHPRAFQRLAGGRSYALAASLCALPFLLVACGECHGLERLPTLAGAVLLPLVWTRANRQPFFAALAPPLVLFFAIEVRDYEPLLCLMPLLGLGVVRAAEHLPAFRRLLLGDEEEARTRQLSIFMQGSLALVGMVLMARAYHHSPFILVPLVASLVLMPGPTPSVRVSLGVGLLLFTYPLHPGAVGLLLALGLLTHHAPVRLWALFRCAPDPLLRPITVVGAAALASWSIADSPTPEAIVLLAGVVGVGAFLLSQRWMLAAAPLVLAAASLGRTSEHAFLAWRPEAALVFAVVGLGAAVLSALCQWGSVQRTLTRWSERLSPGIHDTWSEPLWRAGAIATALPVVQYLLNGTLGGLPLMAAVLAGLTSLVLMVTRERLQANVATALLAGVLVAAVPPLWSPVVVAGTGFVLCMLGTWLENQDVEVGGALHYSGAVLAPLSLLGLRHPEHPATAACLVFCLTTAWALVYRRREWEAAGWVATLVVLHALLAHVGVRLSTGQGVEFILPVFGALSALLATLVLAVAGESVRRSVGHGFAKLALLEVLGGLVLVRAGAEGVANSGIGACVCLAVLFFALVRRGVREEDEESAFLAQGTLVLGYLAVRLHALGSGLSPADSLVALVGGVIFSGLYVFVQREGAGLPAFRRPALFGAYLFPLAGLLTAPWSEPLYVAALLVGYAAHFAALAAHPSQRGMGALVSAAAFNGALALVWLGTGAGEPQFYVIPAGLSLLVLLRVFQDVLEPDTRVKLRALAITVVYVAGAWKPLLFADGRAMFGCVFLCVVGVAAGMALRIRSYVYLGSAFLVTCVVANLARFGIQEHRLGAAFLSLLGVGVVGFMVLFTAKRAELLERYERVRAMMATWEG